MTTLTLPNKFSLREALIAPFAAVGNGLIAIAERRFEASGLSDICAMTDEELAAKGLNRQDVMQQAMGRFY